MKTVELPHPMLIASSATTSLALRYEFLTELSWHTARFTGEANETYQRFRIRVTTFQFGHQPATTHDLFAFGLPHLSPSQIGPMQFTVRCTFTLRLVLIRQPHCLGPCMEKCALQWFLIACATLFGHSISTTPNPPTTQHNSIDFTPMTFATATF